MSEVSLKAFVESTWFKGLARAAMFVGAIGIGYIAGQLSNIDYRTDKMETAVQEIKETQGLRAKDNENFQTFVATSFSSVDAKFSAQRTEFSDFRDQQQRTAEALAKLTGAVEALSKRQLASARHYNEGAL